MKKTRLLSLVGVEVSLSCHGQTPAIVGCVIYYRQTTGWTVNYHVTDSQPVFVSRYNTVLSRKNVQYSKLLFKPIVLSKKYLQ